MHLPLGPMAQQTEEHAELPELVAIEDLTAGALDAAAREMAHEQDEAAAWPTATA